MGLWDCKPGPRSLSPLESASTPVAARLTLPELRGFASRPRGRFAFSTLVLAGDVSACQIEDLTPAEGDFVHVARVAQVLGPRLLILFAALLRLTVLVTSRPPP